MKGCNIMPPPPALEFKSASFQKGFFFFLFDIGVFLIPLSLCGQIYRRALKQSEMMTSIHWM